jgi:uncharacterized protein (DUF433 family)
MGFGGFSCKLVSNGCGIVSFLGGDYFEEILEDFPKLTREDILACLAYAADVEKEKLVFAS